jgi:hypothetical protein
VISSVVRVLDLDVPWILAPERYDPRREGGAEFTVRLGDVAHIVKDTIAPPGDVGVSYLVLDTGDAHAGVASTDKTPRPGDVALGSSKKRTRAGDVVISRLRPYLRQVALIDEGLAPDGVEIATSTEFFVLRSVDENSIAFLVPVLLSARVQDALAAAQEGGHHPRFSETTLARIGIPEAAVARRDEASRNVQAAVTQVREGERALREMTRHFDTEVPIPTPS